MKLWRISGTTPLYGSVVVGGSKNAALPILAASILASEPVTLQGVPDVVDVRTLSLVLGHLGVEVAQQGEGRLDVETVDPLRTRAQWELVRRMRASFCVLGPLLARRGRAAVSLPGGCAIGTRPVDLHLAGLAALGADVRIEHGYVIAQARQLRGAEIDLMGPCGSTVTGTANVLSAAVLARGRTVLRGAAREPEIVDLGKFLIALGARIEGLGTSTLEVTGVEQLGGATYRIISDRIEAATLLVAPVIAGGKVCVRGARAEHLSAVLDVLSAAGAEIQCAEGSSGDRAITVQRCGSLRGFSAVARPYPGVPTDVQAQLMALAAVADGTSEIVDDVFPERFMHVAELARLGARIERHGNTATLEGPVRLAGADVMAGDLRAGAALVLAGLVASGETTIRRIYHLARGYERLDKKLVSLGASIAVEEEGGRWLVDGGWWTRKRTSHQSPSTMH